MAGNKTDIYQFFFVRICVIPTGTDTMLRNMYFTYLVTFKCPDLEQIKFEYY